MEYNEAKLTLDDIYLKYSANKLSNQDKETVEELLSDIAGLKEIDLSLVVSEMLRFSNKISKRFFTAVSEKISPDQYEALLKAMLDTALKSEDLSDIGIKLEKAASQAVNHYGDAAYSMSSISDIVVFIADISKKTKGSLFDSVVKNTDGKILFADYSSLAKSGLDTIKKAIDGAIKNETKEEYQACINNWIEKYKAKRAKSKKSNSKKETDDKKNQDQAQEQQADNSQSIANEDKNKGKTQTAQKNKTKTKKEAKTSTKVDSDSNNNDSTLTVLDNIDRQLSVDKTEIVETILQALEPINDQLSAINGEITKSREIATENESLKSVVSSLRLDVAKYKGLLEKSDNIKIELQEEIDGLKEQLSAIEAKNKELDEKLNEAYSINSRESSLEAEKVRAELKKAFEFLYEDWLEYEFSDVNEDNYLSLQAIIKKTFRALERNGINFKENT